MMMVFLRVFDNFFVFSFWFLQGRLRLGEGMEQYGVWFFRHGCFLHSGMMGRFNGVGLKMEVNVV